MTNNYHNPRARWMRGSLFAMSLLVSWLILLSGCVAKGSLKLKGDNDQEAIALGFVQVEATGPYSRGYQTQLRFFHLLNINTQERIRVDVKSDDKAFAVTLAPGEYEVIRVQLNEGPMMVEAYVNLRFQVLPSGTTYLGMWQFDVDTPRTQRMLRTEISHEQLHWDKISEMYRSLKEETMVVSLPDPRIDETSLFIVAPNPKISYYYR